MSEEFIVIHTEWGRHWSGGTQQVALLLEGLAQRGVNNYLVCQESSMLAERMQGKVPLKTFDLRGEGDLRTWWNFFRWLKVFRERQSALDHILLVHVHSRRGALPTLFIARKLNLPTVLHWRVAAPVRFPLKFVDAVIAVSDAAAQQVLKSGLPTEKVAVVRSCIDTKFFEPTDGAREQMREHLEIKSDEFVIAAVGRLVKGKGYDVLLRALSQIPTSNRPILLLAGDGSERQQLENLSTELGISERARFLGFQTDVRPILWAADVFIHVPTNFPEGTPNAILEAMASGLPVIASKVGGIPEVVRDNETGLIVPPNDQEALAEAIKKLQQDKPLREQFGKRAQAWVQEHHDTRQLPERVLKVYNQISHYQLGCSGL
ncbi:MAG: glycosyltransferase family 4 protein [Armatimonadota bacterium]